MSIRGILILFFLLIISQLISSKSDLYFSKSIWKNVPQLFHNSDQRKTDGQFGKIEELSCLALPNKMAADKKQIGSINFDPVVVNQDYLPISIRSKFCTDSSENQRLDWNFVDRG